VSTDADTGFDKLPILAELRDRLSEHYRASAPGRARHPRLVRSRGWRPLALIAVLVLGGATGALAAAGVFESSSTQLSNKYIRPEVLRAINSAVCARRTVPATTTGIPPASLLSILGVLRRPAAREGAFDVLSRLGGVYPGLYIKYVRFARAVDGLDWYVSVSAGDVGILGPVHINRCVAAQTASFDRELPSIPKALRADATQIFNAQVQSERSFDARNPPVSVNLTGLGPYGGQGPSFGEATAADIEDGALASGGSLTGSGPDTASVEGVVPDGVASVTLHYDAGPASAYGHTHAPAANITTKPVNNAIVVTVPRNVGNATPQTIIWRAANGRIIKTITRH
jgi:hypothetical protein